MKKYCFITDEKLGLVQLGAGCSDEYYKEIGMKLRDVQQSDIDYQWYITEKCPMKTPEQKFKEAKENKYNEALEKANHYIECTALYRDIECTEGNISKLTAFLIAMQQGLYETIAWVTKHDKVIELKIDDVMDILQGIGEIQSNTWTIKYMQFKQQIDNATTIKEVESIVIEY